LLILSCGRNSEGDINTIKEAAQKFELLFDKEPTKKDLEDALSLILEVEEIFSYYVNDANSDETLSFIRLLNDLEEFDDRVDDREDLKEALDELKEVIGEVKEEIDEM
jgi:chromosome segregation ATPase